MPTLPIIRPEGRVPSLELPRPGSESFGSQGFKALGELGETFRKIDDEIRAVEEAGTAERLIRGAAVKFDDEYERLSTEGDYQTFGPSFAEARKKISEGAQEEIKALSPRAQKALIPEIERISAYYEIRGNRKSRELRANHEIADVDEAININARLAARAELPEQREYFTGLGLGKIKAISRLIGEPRAQDLSERFKKQVSTEREKYFTTDLQDRLDDLSNRARRDPSVALALQREGERLIEDAGGDWLPPEKISAAKSAYRVSVWDSAVRANIEQNPVQALKELNEGKYDTVLDKRHLEGLRGQAENDIDRLARKADAERKERERQIGKLVSDYKEAKMAGYDWRGPVSEAKLAQLARGTEHEGDFVNVQAASRVLGQFNQLPPLAQEQYLRQLSTGAKTGTEAKFAKTLEAAHQTAKTLLDKDPLTFAVRQRVIPAPALPLNLSDPATLQERSRLAGIAEQHYGRPVSPLSDDEVEQLRTAIEQSPADGKVAILRSLRAGLEDRQIKAVAGQLAKKKEDNVMALALGISAEAPAVASRILQGREILKDNPKVNPSGVALATARDRVNEILGEAYAHNPEHHEAVSEAAMAIYGLRAWQERDLSGVYKRSRMDEAVQEATGGLLSISRGFLRGSYRIQPPRRGMTESQFNEALKGADYRGARGFKAEDIQTHGTFESIGAGRYLVRVGPGYVQGERGPFILDLSGGK